MSKLAINTGVQENNLLVEMSGELELTSTKLFEDEVNAALESSGCERVILDCSKLEFVDSSGLGAIVALLRRFKESSGEVVLAGVRAGLLELLYITKLEKYFKLYKNVEEAVTAGETVVDPGLEHVSHPQRHEPEHSAKRVNPAADADQASAGARLPAYEGMANYPTWYTVHWFLTREELHQKSTEIVSNAATDREATRGLHRLLLTRCDGALKASTMVSGLFGFALGYVNWAEVLEEIRRNPAKSVNQTLG